MARRCAPCTGLWKDDYPPLSDVKRLENVDRIVVYLKERPRAAIGHKKLGNAEMARRSVAGRAKDAEYKESELLRMPLQELLKLHKKIFGSAPPGNFSAAGIAAEIVQYTKSYVPAKDAAPRYKPTDCIYNPPS